MVAHDAPETRRLRASLEAGGRAVVWVQSREAAINVLDSAVVDALITRLRARRIRGMALLDLARKRNPDVGAILLIKPDEVEQATRAMRRGVIDFQTAPFNLEKITAVLDRLEERQRLAAEFSRLSQRLDHEFGFPNLVGNSSAMARLRAHLKEIAPLEVHVLVHGEEGVGKRTLARTLHLNSPRRNAPLVEVDCAVIPPRQLARELFGVPSPGPGARRPGRLEVAAEGTLYLSEVGALPREIQSRIADTLRTGQIRPEIDAPPVEVRPRVVASSRSDLAGSVEQGRFDEGLFTLLGESRIEIPPLRHRRRDIPVLARHFLAEAAQEVSRTLSLSRAALGSLSDYEWPGNCRELKGVIAELAASTPAGVTIGGDDLPTGIRDSRPREGFLGVPLGTSLPEAERRLILETVRLCGGNREKAAAILGIGVRTLYRKLRSYAADEGAT